MALHPLHNPAHNYCRRPRRLLHLDPPHKIPRPLPPPRNPPLPIHPSHIRTLHRLPPPHLRRKLPGCTRPERST
ncbi:hypothetical protein EMPG_16400 [Blastomyces silverae]|uniref:Uncharacterized protein n=1 Tax=Blastomyces silverae TaxID=2060906 RepID=A0A0H1BG34_9EURO|nr:hypothetical protein EMPG_16400 [Blastomyces silverae]